MNAITLAQFFGLVNARLTYTNDIDLFMSPPTHSASKVLKRKLGLSDSASITVDQIPLMKFIKLTAGEMQRALRIDSQLTKLLQDLFMRFGCHCAAT